MSIFRELIQQDQNCRAQEKLNTLLIEGFESLEQGSSIETTDEWWEQVYGTQDIQNILGREG